MLSWGDLYSKCLVLQNDKLKEKCVYCVKCSYRIKDNTDYRLTALLFFSQDTKWQRIVVCDRKDDPARFTQTESLELSENHKQASDV